MSLCLLVFNRTHQSIHPQLVALVFFKGAHPLHPLFFCQVVITLPRFVDFIRNRGLNRGVEFNEKGGKRRGRCSMMCSLTQCQFFHPGHNLQPSSYPLACTMSTMLIPLSPAQLLALCACLFVDGDLLFIPGKIKNFYKSRVFKKNKEKKKDTALGKFIHPYPVSRSSLFLTYFLPLFKIPPTNPA